MLNCSLKLAFFNLVSDNVYLMIQESFLKMFVI